MGKMLFVDLTSGESHEETLDADICRDFLGGYGLGARILYERMPAGADPLGPDNLLGFVTGPFTGTPAICSGRFTVVAKSPLTGGWGDANCGGVWGPYLRFAGYDAVFFRGVAETPVYVLIDDGAVTFHDASNLWGKDCLDTEEALRAEHGDDAAVACIGPPGENLSLLSSIMHDYHRAAARSGLGAVMGSKRLKAVLVRGTQEVPLFDPALMKELRKKWSRQLMGEGVDFKTYGTTSRTIPNTVIGDTPIRNWTGTYPEDYPDPSLDKIDEHAFYTDHGKTYGCWHCHIRCGALLKPRPGRAKSSYMPEYETIAVSGPLCQNDDKESIIRFNDVCNVYGMDTISVGGAVAFAIECFERGILTLEDTGMELRFGDGDCVVALAGKIARREGIGALLADGVMRAAEAIGHGSEEFAVHAGGQELSAHDPRFFPSLLLVYRMDATPGRHPRGGSSWIMGSGFMEAPADKYAVEGVGESHKRAAAMCHVMSSCGNCLFAYTSHPTGYIPEFLTAITGHEHDFDSCVKIGERIEDMRHLFNLREGYNPLTISFNQRSLGRPPLEKGATAGITIDEEALIDEYCAAMEWDRQTAMPSRDKLEELGLRELVEQYGGASR